MSYGCSFGFSAPGTQYWNPQENLAENYGTQYAYSNTVMVETPRAVHGGNVYAGTEPVHVGSGSSGQGYFDHSAYKDDPELGGGTVFKPDGMLFDDKSIRAGFIRKVVYLIFLNHVL